MNNLQVVREFFQLSLKQVSEDLGWDVEELQALEAGKAANPLTWQILAEYYAQQFHVIAIDEQQVEPIHFRLSVDYLMNVGLTMNDLVAFKWYFENTRAELGDFCVALYEPGTGQITQKFTDLSAILEQFAGYILLNHDGSMNNFINERDHNHVSEWRLILFKRDNLVVDVTDQLVYFEELVNRTVI
ncbi:XRE family transcriptional regulator [Weissella kandleri]|uniref:XRE family transcriptional regulator n=1 Tax=Weissella kandleri TaxID=1616 RepID=UPI00387E4A98